MPSDLPKTYEPLLLTFYNEPRRDGTWLVIGDDYGTELRVDAAGNLYSIDPAGRHITRFVNSSVDKLALFLEAHREFVSMSFTEESSQLAAINSFREQLATVDPLAFSDRESWWAVVIEQMLLF